MIDPEKKARIIAEGPYVYFIEDAPRQRIKIGYAKDPIDRLCGVMSHLRSDHRVGDVGPLTFIYGGEDLEYDLHAMFARFRYRNEREWFHDCPEIRAYVASHPTVLSFDMDGLGRTTWNRDERWEQDREQHALVLRRRAGWACKCDECVERRQRIGIPENRRKRTVWPCACGQCRKCRNRESMRKWREAQK